jgi:hypothetical protein
MGPTRRKSAWPVRDREKCCLKGGRLISKHHEAEDGRGVQRSWKWHRFEIRRVFLKRGIGARRIATGKNIPGLQGAPGQ